MFSKRSLTEMLLKLGIAVITLLALNYIVEAEVPTFVNFLEIDGELSKRIRREVSDDDTDHWNNQLLTWSRIVQILTKNNYDISMMGWQNIYDSEGKIKRVDTIELVFPTINPQKVDNWDKDRSVTRGDQHKIIESLTVYTSLARERDLLVDVVAEKFRKDGSTEAFLYWNPSTTYFKVDGIVTFNKTQVATKEEIEKFRNSLPESGQALPPVTIKLDADGVVTTPEDEIGRCSVVAYVVDFNDASDDIIIEGPKLMAKIFAKNVQQPKEIPKKLAERFDEEFKEYDWQVLVNPGEFYIESNVWIKLSLDGFEFFADEKDVYMVYGIKK